MYYGQVILAVRGTYQIRLTKNGAIATKSMMLRSEVKNVTFDGELINRRVSSETEFSSLCMAKQRSNEGETNRS